MKQGHSNRCLTTVVSAFFGLSHMNVDKVIIFTEESEIKLMPYQFVE